MGLKKIKPDQDRLGEFRLGYVRLEDVGSIDGERRVG